MKSIWMACFACFPTLTMAGQLVFQLERIDSQKRPIGPYANQSMTVYYDRKGGSDQEVLTTDAEGKISIPLRENPVIPALYIRWDGSPECEDDQKYVVAEPNFMPYLAKRLRESNPGLKVDKSLILRTEFTSTLGVYYPVYSSSGLKFKTGSAAIEDSQTNRAILDDMAAFVAGNQKNYPCREIEIQGHTDSDGDAGANQTLSEGRAKAVWDELSHYDGVEMSSVSTRGFGETAPVKTGGIEDKAKSRRVEIVILKND